MHKASPVELRTSIEMAHSLAQIGVRFVPIPVETDGNDSNLLIVFYVQIMPDDFVMQLHRF